MDGNFQLDRKRANGEGQYDGLTDGTAYFPKQEQFMAYLSSVTDERVVSVNVSLLVLTRNQTPNFLSQGHATYLKS